jgi:hypothetical protein
MLASEHQYLREERSGTLATVSGEVRPGYDLLTRIVTGTFSNLSDLTYPTWYKLVELYTLRKLTFVEDRFPAIWSLAKMFQEANVDRYIAGLWEKDLLRGLVFTRETEDKSTLGANGTSPSWSWASMEGQVKFADSGYTIQKYLKSSNDAEIMNIKDIKKGSNHMGRISRAAITLSAYCTVRSCKPCEPPKPDPNTVHPVFQSSKMRRNASYKPWLASLPHGEGSVPRPPFEREKNPGELPPFNRYLFGGFNNDENPYGDRTWWRRVGFSDGQMGDGNFSEHTIVFDKRETANKYAGDRTKTIMLLYITGGLEDGVGNMRGLAVVLIDGCENEYQRVGVVYFNQFYMLQNPPPSYSAWDSRVITII